MAETDMQKVHEMNNKQQSCEQDISHISDDIELPQQVNPEQQHVLEKLVSLLKNMSREFRTDFWKIVHNHNGTSHELSPKIIDFVQRHGFDIPHFRILDNATSESEISRIREEQAERLGTHFSDLQEEDEFRPKHEFTVIFVLPKQVSQYWKKGNGSSWTGGLPDVGADIIPWGYYYRKTIGNIRSDIDRSNENGDLYFDRVPGIAHTLEHYYIWNVSTQLSETDIRKQQEDKARSEQMTVIKDILAEYLEETK